MINSDKTKITAPISIEDVRQVLVDSSRDLGTLCKSEKINMWALHKPIDYDSLIGCGSGVGITISGGASSNPYEALLRTFKYNRPKGGLHSPYRLTDFVGYKHNSSAPIDSVVVGDNSITMIVNNHYGEDMPIDSIDELFTTATSQSGSSGTTTDNLGMLYACVVYLATDDTSKLISAFKDVTSGSAQSTMSVRALSSTSGTDGDTDGEAVGGGEGNVGQVDDDVQQIPPMLAEEVSAWDGSVQPNNLWSKDKFNNQSNVYFFWATSEEPISSYDGTMTIDTTYITKPWELGSNSIGVPSGCNYYLGFVCAVDHKYTNGDTYPSGTLKFLPLPTKKQSDAVFYSNFDWQQVDSAPSDSDVEQAL